MNEKARGIISPDPSSTFSFTLELSGGTAAYSVAAVLPSFISADLLISVHDR